MQVIYTHEDHMHAHPMGGHPMYAHPMQVIYTHEDPRTGDSRSHYVHSVQQKDRSLSDGIWYKANFYLYMHL